MGLRNWWNDRKQKAAKTRQDLEIENDQDLIAQQVPEVVGKSDVERMAYILEQIEDWNSYCTPEQAATFATRLKASQEAWQGDGMTMPTWGSLWVLRRFQRELGMDVPQVASPPNSHQE